MARFVCVGVGVCEHVSRERSGREHGGDASLNTASVFRCVPYSGEPYPSS